MIIKKSKIKSKLIEIGIRSSEEYFEKLNLILEEIINESVSECRKDNRKTLLARDL